MKKPQLWKAFCKDKMVASVIPSSKLSVKKLCKSIDFSRDIVIVEYGAGTGVFTKYMLQKMTPGSKIIAIETNAHLVDLLNEIDDERLIVYHDSAERIHEILNEVHETEVDYVLSGIPFSYIDEEVKNGIMSDTYQILKDGGKFLVYQCTGNAKKYLQNYFSTIYSSYQVFNIPMLYMWEAVK